MELTPDRAIVRDIAELDTLRMLMRGFASLARREFGLSEEVLADVDAATEAVGTSQVLDAEARQRTGIDVTRSEHRFGEPYLGIIKVAVAVAAQQPDVLRPYVSPDEFDSIQIYFPPTHQQ